MTMELSDLPSEADLPAALRAKAEGDWREEAAVELLLTGAGIFWREPSWQQACVSVDHFDDHGTVLTLAEVDWHTATQATPIVTGATSQQAAIVKVAAALATGSSGAALSQVHPDDLMSVLTAIAHVVTGPPHF